MSKKISRRTALKAGIASVGIPTFIPSTALGDATTKAPSERVTLGHIGVGTRGSGLFTTAKNSRQVQVVGVADCFEERREKAAAEVGADAYRDFRDLLSRDDIDGVVIATPDHWHVPIAMMAAAAGKDAYVEKPLGVSIEQDLACQKAFRENNRVFQYGTQQRASEHIQAGKEIVRSGQLGELRTIEVKAPNGGRGGSTKAAPLPAGFDYDMWLGPAPEAPYTVDRCKAWGGSYWCYDYSIGYLGGWGAHPLDVMVLCYDGDQAGPFTVEGTGAIPDQGLFNTVVDWDMELRMADGVKIKFTPDRNSTKFIGTQGKLELTRGAIRTFPKELMPAGLPEDKQANTSRRHLENFANCIRTRELTASHIDDAVRSDIVSLLCDIAVRTGEKITWDPAKQEIVGGSARARAMTSRAMRAPWTL